MLTFLANFFFTSFPLKRFLCLYRQRRAVCCGEQAVCRFVSLLRRAAGKQASGQDFLLKATKFCCPGEQRARFYSLFCKSEAEKGNFRVFTACEAAKFSLIAG